MITGASPFCIITVRELTLRTLYPLLNWYPIIEYPQKFEYPS